MYSETNASAKISEQQKGNDLVRDRADRCAMNTKEIAVCERSEVVCPDACW